MTGAEYRNHHCDYDIQEDPLTENCGHHSFKIKYRSNSFTSVGSDQDLPTIKVLGTGGTIASKGLVQHQTAGYKVDLTIEDLIDSIPDLSGTCYLQYEQVFNIDSKEFTCEELNLLRKKVLEDLEVCDGVVITHGTDTMEETSFFLQITIDSDKPIVLCGSMRPSTAISSDGPMNLYQAIVIAANKKSRRRGVLVALNDSIGSGFYITKSNANSLDTFKSIGQGYIGSFVNNEVHYYFPPAKPMSLNCFDLDDNICCFPEVLIFYAHQGMCLEFIKHSIEYIQPQGVVFATMGAGSLSDKTNALLHKLSKKYSLPVVYSKRSMDGMVPKGGLPTVTDSEGHLVPMPYAIASGYLNPQKSRILLQLCLINKMSTDEIKKAFLAIYGG